MGRGEQGRDKNAEGDQNLQSAPLHNVLHAPIHLAMLADGNEQISDFKRTAFSDIRGEERVIVWMIVHRKCLGVPGKFEIFSAKTVGPRGRIDHVPDDLRFGIILRGRKREGRGDRGSASGLYGRMRF
jgi:hypothetical protein